MILTLISAASMLFTISTTSIKEKEVIEILLGKPGYEAMREEIMAKLDK